MPASAYKLTTYTYDSRGRLTQLTDGLGQIESYTYDNNNNLITKTLRDGKQERYTYNALGMIVTDNVYASATATAPLSTRTYTYYPTGALKSVTEDGTTLKRYRTNGNRPYLQAENKSYSEARRSLYPQEIRVQGLALKVIKELQA